MCSGLAETPPQTLPSEVMYASLTALCVFFGLSLLAVGPLDSTENSWKQDRGGVTLLPDVRVNHRASDLKAVLLKTSEPANGNIKYIYDRKCSILVMLILAF